MFASVFSLTTIAEKNDKGSWMGWDIQFDHTLDMTNDQEREYYMAARAFCQSVNKGEVKTQDLDAAATATGQGSAGVDDEIDK